MHSYSPSIRGFQMLSPRETQLILLSGEGLTDKEIARELGISIGTVITLWSKLRAKLAITSRISAVSMMTAVVSRLNARVSGLSQENENYETMLGKLSGVRLLVNRKLIVLSCSVRASTLLGIKPGLSLAEERGAVVLNDGGNPVSNFDTPWGHALSRQEDVLGASITISHQGVSDDYSVDCHSLDHPVLNRIAVVEFKPIGANAVVELARESAQHPSVHSLAS